MKKFTSPLVAFFLCLSLALSYAFSADIILADSFEGDDPPSEHTEFRLLSAVVSTPINDTVTVSGETHWIQGDAGQIEVTNTRTNLKVVASVQAGGGFTLSLPQTRVGDQLSLLPIADNGQIGTAVTLTVQGTATEPPLLPNPGNFAPELSTTAVNTLYDLTEFLYKGSPKIQLGMADDTIAPQRASLLVGKVLDKQNNPLTGVKISIKDLPEYGYTTSRADGEWDLVVNGGRQLVVNYQKDGFLPVQRKVQVKWQDYGYLPDVVMIPLDTRVSFINLNETDQDFQVHQSSYSEDADGRRRTTVLFPKGVRAAMVLADGSEQSLSQLNVRVTEYTVGENGPETMPGELPPATGYTFAAEFSVDQAIAAGASTVKFSQPVVVYEDNFLNFPVGEAVPVGYYDNTIATWIPAPNGRIIKVLAVNNGQAVLDVTGHGIAATAAELAELAITTAELGELAKLYQAGDSVWRVLTTHFTPWDCNWPYGPKPCPGGNYTCAPPMLEPLVIVPLPELEGPPPPPTPPDNEDNVICPGCFIDVENRAVGEHIDIVGVPFKLNYYSAYAGSALTASGGSVSGGGGGNNPPLPRYSKIRLKLTGDKPVASPPINEITAELKMIGRKWQRSFAPDLAENSYATFEWDGRDRYGRRMYACQTAYGKVGYHGELIYYSSRTDMVAAFASYTGGGSGGSSGGGGSSASGVAFFGNRPDLTFAVYARGWVSVCPPLPYEQTPINLNGYGSGGVAIANPSVVSANIGGWTPDILHAYDPLRGVLTMGNGQVRSTSGITDSIQTVTELPGRLTGVFANGDLLYITADNLYRYQLANQSSTALLAQPTEVLGATIAANQVVYVNTPYRVQRLAANGQLTPLLGSGNIAGENADGAEGLTLGLSRNIDFSVNAGGELIFIDGHALRKLGLDGRVSTIAGVRNRSGSIEANPDERFLLSPRSPVVNQAGEIFFIDQSGIIIRKVAVSGQISTYAGNGERANFALADSEGKIAAEFPISASGLGIDLHNRVVFYNQAALRTINSNGHLETLVGKLYTEIPNNNNSLSSTFFYYDGVYNHPDYGLLFPGKIWLNQTNTVYKLSNGMPRFNNKEIVIPNSNGSLAYVFSARGQHLKTYDALSGAVLYAFTYHADGTLNSITDADGLVTTVSHDKITGPFGQETTLAYSDGLLSSVSNPAGEVHSMQYDTGLLTHFTKPDGQTTVLTYDELGKLVKDQWPNGGGWDISGSKTVNGNHSEETVTLASGEGRVSTFKTTNKRYNFIGRRTYQTEKETTAADGTTATSIIYSGGYQRSTLANGTWTGYSLTSSSVFGNLAKYPSSAFIATPGGKNVSYSQTRTVELDDDGNLFPVKTFSATSKRNDNEVATNTYNHAERTWTQTSATGQQVVTTVDDVHRPLNVRSEGLPTLDYQYNSNGQLTQTALTNTAGTQTRHINYQYYQSGAAKGYLQSASNDLGQTTAYTYDAAGRVITQTLPDNRVIAFEYYADGELKTITPPNGERHLFSYTTMNDTDAYQPPLLNGQASDTVYRYNKDRQLTQIDLPDGSQVSYNYDTVKGRLNSIQAGSLRYDYHYNDATGELIKLTDAAGNEIAITPDGVLLDQLDYHGAVEAQMTFAYDNNLRLTENNITLNGQTLRQRYSYTADDLLSTSGELSLTYDSTNRLPISNSFGNIEKNISYNNFASPESVQYNYDSSSYADDIRIDQQVVSDDVFTVQGRILDNNIAYVMIDNQRFTIDNQREIHGTITLNGYYNNLSVDYYDSNDQLLHHANQAIYYSYPTGSQAQYLYRLTGAILYYSEDRQTLSVYDSVAKTIVNQAFPVELDNNWKIFGVDNTGVVYYDSYRDKQIKSYQNGGLLATYPYTADNRPSVLTQTGKLYSLRHTGSQGNNKSYVIDEFTANGIVPYTDFEVEGEVSTIAENQSGEGLLAGVAVGYALGGGCEEQGSCLLDGYSEMHDQVFHITPAAPQLLMSNIHNTRFGIYRLLGSATGMICYNIRNGYGCYYPDAGQADNYDYYAINDSYSSMLATPGDRLLHIPYGQRRYPELIDNPGKADEVRALLLSDANLPPLTGTLTINNSGGNYRAYQSDYTYDAIGRITGISEQRVGVSIEHSYTYNNVGKLIEATTDGVTQTWQYDANGNRTHEDGIEVAEYDAQDRLTQYKDNTYQYNALGQLTQKTTPGGTETYDYDVFGNLRGVNLANGVNIEYLIDPKDRRIGKKVNGVIKQKLLYLGQLNPIAELYPDNSVKNLFIYADKSNVPSAMERYDQSGNLTGKYRIISNHLGSVVMVVNAESGTIEQEIEYDVWGNVLSDSNPNFQPFYFAGGIYDTDTKLTRFGARDYDAETGRWTAKDPILFGGGLTSLYDYVDGDPVNWIDPWGLQDTSLDGYDSWSDNPPDLFEAVEHLSLVISACTLNPSTGAAFSQGVKSLFRAGLGPSEKRAIKGLKEHIKEHKTKLKEYIKDPYSQDNKGHLKNAPNQEIKNRIINGRIKHLNNEINTARKNIREIKNGTQSVLQKTKK